MTNDAPIEHRPWVGRNYGEGLGGQRVAIMGYSHWDDAPDTSDKTEQTIADVVENDGGAKFFTAIRNYFGFTSHDAFWSRVMFFNFIPATIGDGAARYRTADEAVCQVAERRFTRLMANHMPNKVFVFTGKVWERLPNGSQNHGPLGPGCPYEWISYNTPPTAVVLLRHPQGANRQVMARAVQLGMDLQPI